jgi:tetratricopeptide (TPR) repeat protein
MNDDLARDILGELRKQTAANEEALRMNTEMREETRKRMDDSIALLSRTRKESRWTLLAFVVVMLAIFAFPMVSSWTFMYADSETMQDEVEGEAALAGAFRPGVKKYQATAYAQSGQYEMLDAIEDSLLKAFPHDAEVAQILAKAHFDRGNLDRARALFEVSEGLLHDDLNVRHLEAIARRQATPPVVAITPPVWRDGDSRAGGLRQ